jgi:hypothetical protein
MVSCALSGVQMRPRTNRGHSLSRFSVPLLPKPHDLLKFAVEAHGGLSRWNQLNFVKADVSITETI